MELEPELKWILLIGASYAFISSGIFSRLLSEFTEEWLHKRKGIIYKLAVILFFIFLILSSFASLIACLYVIKEIIKTEEKPEIYYIPALIIGALFFAIGYWLLNRTKGMIAKERKTPKGIKIKNLFK